MDRSEIKDKRRRKMSGRDVDRSSVEDAAAVAEDLLPDPDARQAFAEVLAQAVVEADAAAPESWSLTLFPACIRLNVGRLLVIEVLSGVVWTWALTNDPTFGAVADWEIGEGTFKSLNQEHVALGVAEGDLAGLRQALIEVVGRSAAAATDTAMRSPYRDRSWSQGVLDWLERQTGRELPQPTLRASEPADPSVAEPSSDRRWWIFQSNPDQYDIPALVRSDRGWVDWTVTRYADQIRPGDRVFLWESGKKAAIHGVGTVTSAPKMTTPEFDPFSRSPGTEAEIAARVEIDRVVDPPLPRTVVKETPGLEELLIIRSPTGTNFPVEPDEVEVLRSLLPPDAPFSELMTDLSESLHFPTELVANVLLSLQVKRFVILTGISGTGKTRLAMSIAQRFRRRTVTVPAPELSGSAAMLTMQPYMREHRRMSVPAALVAQIPRLANLERSSMPISVRYPGGTAKLTANKHDATQLLLKGRVREWFLDTFELDDPFVLRIADPDADAPDTLVLEPPKATETRTVELSNLAVVPVRPDWTDNRGLLGYRNPITEEYVATRFLRTLLHAGREARAAKAEKRAPTPFFVVLDEMNLARVEHYFSDFLSCLESGEAIDLHDDEKIEEGSDGNDPPIPRKLEIPPNVFFVGTVNVDETTYMFSPKVLDRAFAIELNHVDLRGFGAHVDSDTPLALDGWDGSLVVTHNPAREDWLAFSELEGGALREVLLEIHDRLTLEHRHFGYRVANEIGRYVVLARQQANTSKAAWAALDLAVLQKVLPKLYGTQQELEVLLQDLRTIASDPTATDEDSPAPPARLPRTVTKLSRMIRRLRQVGFAAWVE